VELQIELAFFFGATAAIVVGGYQVRGRLVVALRLMEHRAPRPPSQFF